jgi:hypothetical protein
MFSLLDDSCNRFNLDVCIKTIHLDFEDRMHVTVTNLFPDVVIKSCRFHLGQAWWRKIQALGLAKEYKKSVTDISTCKCIFGANQYRPNV